MERNVFDSRDMDVVLASGGFTGMDDDKAMEAIKSAVANPVDGNGRRVPADMYDADAAARYLVGEYTKSITQELVDVASGVADRFHDRTREVVDAAVSSVAGVGMDEYRLARLRRDAGDPSDLLRIYARYVERS